MKIIVLGGFLGSGKTSVLMNMAHYLVANSTSNNEYKVAIIENEIGETGIDDQFIRNDGYSVENLFAGCACCSLSGELIASISKLKNEMNPEWLIIEATGVAYPAGIKTRVKELLDIDSTIITIVDAKRWKRLRAAMETLVLGQLESASAVLINKIDLVDEETLENVKDGVRECNQIVEMFCVSAQNGIDEAVWKSIFN